MMLVWMTKAMKIVRMKATALSKILKTTAVKIKRRVNWKSSLARILERISADEQTENREDILKERNKKKSQQNAENIQQ
jgi:hypothetical protein